MRPPLSPIVKRQWADIRAAKAWMDAQVDGVCHYCGRKVVAGGSDVGLHPSVDHVTPQARGGEDIHGNYVLSCRACNSAKGKKSVENARHFIALVALGWPKFSVAQIEWLRSQGFDLSTYDSFRFHFERNEPCPPAYVDEVLS